ncbi:MAG: DUF4153 domain-containing protein [Candidatus Desantisbacteria bacterium]
MKPEDILNAIGSPKSLEILYREDPSAFERLFPEIFRNNPNSPILQVWHERLFYDAKEEQDFVSCDTKEKSKAIVVTIGLSLIAGTLIKLPDFIAAMNDELYFTRNTGFIVIMALAAYFLIVKINRKCDICVVVLPALIGLLFINLLPDRSDSQTITLSYLHMPFFVWSLLGLSYLGGSWRNLQHCMEFIRYNGELVVYTTIILMGGTVLTVITMALFELINVRIENWYMKYVVLYGTVASPIVGTLIIDNMVGKRFKIAPLLARIFTPLFLVTVIAYLVAMIIRQKSPYTDREFLITFNGLLLIVLSLSILAIAERNTKGRVGISDIMNIGLVAGTLIIDMVALSAILFRLSSYGFTPNRVAVLGANVIVFCHLAGILYFYIRVMKENSRIIMLENWIARYIPIYTAWSIIVAFGFPIAFWFK